jgi:hypothetical protein
MGSQSRTPSVRRPADGGISVVPRSNNPVSKELADAPSRADALWKVGQMHAERGDHARNFRRCMGYQVFVGSVLRVVNCERTTRGATFKVWTGTVRFHSR